MTHPTLKNIAGALAQIGSVRVAYRRALGDQPGRSETSARELIGHAADLIPGYRTDFRVSTHKKDGFIYAHRRPIEMPKCDDKHPTVTERPRDIAWGPGEGAEE